jgi:hypothetical protein
MITSGPRVSTRNTSIRGPEGVGAVAAAPDPTESPQARRENAAGWMRSTGGF